MHSGITMKRVIRSAIYACLILILAGCGDDCWDGYYYYPYPPAPYVINILSNPALDGYITKDPVTSSLTVIQGMSSTVQSVFAGIDPVTLAESRGFIDFPSGVPFNRFIISAVINIFINTIQTPNASIPVRIDLVSAPPPLIGSDFDSASLATVSSTLFQTDAGQYVNIDVTPLLIQAQTLQLTDFQIRILVPTAPGFFEINDSTGANRGQLAPLLKVTYS